MYKFCDFVINSLKWPVFVISLIYISALLQVFDYFDLHTTKCYALGAGIILYVVIIVTAGRNICSSMQIISHELTHMFFAYLTFHNAGRIRIDPEGLGGSMRIKGRGNWVISLSPYFFPLFAFFYMLTMPFIMRITGDYWVLYTILGYFVAYYWATVLSQVHPGQTDIIKEGYVFSTVVIVAANLMITGILLAYTNRSWDGVGMYFDTVQKLQDKNWSAVEQLFRKYF